MKKLFTLFALLAMFMSAKAVHIVDARVDFSEQTEVKFWSWGSESAQARLSILDGCLHFHSSEATDPNWDCQFVPIGCDNVEPGTTYTLKLKMKGDHAQNISAVGFGGSEAWGNLAVPTDWQEIEIVYEATKTDGGVLIQCGDYVGDWDIAWMEISHDGKQERPATWKELLVNGDAEKSWEELGLADIANDDAENNYKVAIWAKERDRHLTADGGFATLPATIEVEEGNPNNHVFALHTPAATTEGDAAAWDSQVWFESPRAWKTGEQYKLSFRYKASVPVRTATQVHHQNPGDYLYWQAIGDIDFTTEWQVFEKEITVPADANGMWSIAFNLNQNSKEPMDFYFDDLSWSEMELDHGLFVASANTETSLVDYDFDNAVEFVYDDDVMALAATVGTKGNKNSWVNEVMISTVRGNDRQFKANTIRTKGAIRPSEYDDLVNGDGEWINYEDGASYKIKLPAQGVWTIFVDEENKIAAFYEVEGDSPKEPVDIVPNENEIIIATVERTMSLDEAKAAGLIADPENPTDEEKATYSGQPWDNQFFLIGDRALAVGEEVFVSFDYMAEAPATVGTQNSKNAGDYLHWAGLGNIEFTPEWQHFETTVAIPSETSGNQNSWTFNLSNAAAANTYHIKNIIFCDADKTETFIDMVEENPKNFQMKIGANTPPIPTDPTGINSVVNNKVANNAIYNIAGQRVSENYKGIVVKNGKKYLNK